MNKFDYAIVVGGKPLFGGFFAFPVSYELTILLGAFGSLVGCLSLTVCRAIIIRCLQMKGSRMLRMTNFTAW